MNQITLTKLTEAYEQYQQALQNFNYADSEHIDKAAVELTDAIRKLKTIVFILYLGVQKL